MDIPRMQVGDVASRFLVRRLRETKAQFNDDSDGRQRKPWEASDGPVRAHNPKVGGSNPPPATNGFSESTRKPTISWAFVLFRRTSTGVSTGLIGTCSALESGSLVTGLLIAAFLLVGLSLASGDEVPQAALDVEAPRV